MLFQSTEAVPVFLRSVAVMEHGAFASSNVLPGAFLKTKSTCRVLTPRFLLVGHVLIKTLLPGEMCSEIDLLLAVQVERLSHNSF
jgi:hypothetical protein